jgi:hypothetical protein
MAYDKNIMLDRVAAGEKTSGRSRGALDGLLAALEPISASLGAVISGNVFQLMQVQQELDELAVEDARGFKDALLYAITELPGLCYTGVVSIQPRLDKSAGAFIDWVRDNTIGHHNSPVFKCDATVFCIASAAGGFRIGFIQDCRSKISQSDFEGGTAIRVASPLRYPIGDALGPPDTPFYGQAGHCTPCTLPPWLEPVSRTGEELKLQMSDDFNGSHFFGKPPSGTHGDVDHTFVSGKYLREQSFTVWLARSDGAFRPNNDPRLFRQIDYVNSTLLTWDAKGNVKCDTSSSKQDPVKVKRITDRRPAVSAPVMPHEEMEVRLSGSHDFVPITQE